MNSSAQVPSDIKATTKKTDLLTYNRIFLKAKYSLYSTVVFFLFANPETMFILQRIFGRVLQIITPSGAPTISGIFLSTALFFITMLGLMLMPSD